MVSDPDMKLEWTMPSPMLLAFKLKDLYLLLEMGKGIGSYFGNGPGLGIGFGSIGPGYSMGDSGMGYSMVYG